MLARTLSSLPDHSVAELALGEQADRRASELTKGADQDVQGTLASIETLTPPEPLTLPSGLRSHFPVVREG
jgi:hypothetical protein